MPEQRKKLAVIDGKSVFYRGYFAMGGLATKDGTPTGGVYGFAVMALEVIKRLKPDYVAVAWDKPKTNIRRRLELYPEYKAGRKPPPPDFYDQIPMLHELLEAFGWPLYEFDDYEADDIMGTLAVMAKERDIETLLVTSDMDMLQLVNDHVHVYALKTGLSNIELYSPASFEAKYGIKVSQFLDLKALKGDSSDNIPGVPGIGEKTALELLKQHQTLDGVYDNLALLKDSTAKKLEAGKDLAYLSKQLADIWTDAPMEFDLAAMDGGKADPARIMEILKKLEFRSLVRQLPEIMRIDDSVERRTSNVEDKTSSQNPTSASSLTEWVVGKNIIVDNNELVLELADNLKKSDQFVIHSRAAGKHGQKAQALVLSPSSGRTFTIILGSVSLQHVMEVLQPFFEDEKIQKIGHDLKSTLQVCYEIGFQVNGVAHDTQVGAFLLNSLRRSFDLTDLASEELGYEGSPVESLDLDEYCSRAPEIVATISALASKQTEEIKKSPQLTDVAKTMDWPIIPILARMEYEGIYLDIEYLKEMSDRVGDMVSDLEQQIYGHADQEFNIASPSQLADILFEKLNLSTLGIKKGKTGYSTAASELDKLRGIHPIIDLITQYREVTKLKNTYIDTLPEQVDENSRLHTTFAMTVAQTGRLSSHDPNLQNIPVKTELGREIRKAFIAAPEHVFIGADYSQFELRIAAYLSGDQDLIDQFNRDVDVHTATAALVYGRNPEDVTKTMRREAKAVNFGVMYGQGPHGLVQTTGMTYAAAKQFIDKYFEVRPKLRAYIDSVKEQAKTLGYVETMFGRRRPTPDVLSSNFMVREGAYRAAVNMPFQGSAADIMKMGMIAVQQKLDEVFGESGERSGKRGSKKLSPISPLLSPAGKPRILLQIHDSILVECIETQAEKVAKIIKEAMENVVDLPIKFTVDTAIGKNWGEL